MNYIFKKNFHLRYIIQFRMNELCEVNLFTNINHNNFIDVFSIHQITKKLRNTKVK